MHIPICSSGEKWSKKQKKGEFCWNPYASVGAAAVGKKVRLWTKRHLTVPVATYTIIELH